MTSDRIVDWVSAEVLPLEAPLRRWLRTAGADPQEVDDVIHDLYARLLDLSSVSHITHPRAYVYQSARNILADRARRRRVVSIGVGVAQAVEDFEVEDPSPSPERAALARAELHWILNVMERLPDRCRKVLQLRRLHGLSQLETARRLGMSEGMVEKETARGMKLISRHIGDIEREALERSEGKDRRAGFGSVNVKHRR